jgi:uncharacterized OsmC-like protein
VATTIVNALDLEPVAALVAAIQEEPTKADTAWHAAVRWTGGFRSEARIRSFEPLLSDEPAGLGGSDSAPNPVEQLAAALGNCLAVGYAAALTARGIAIRELTIDVTGTLDLRAFLGLADAHAGYSRIDVEVHLDADADHDTLRAIHQHVVATSPVGHSLAHPVAVNVELVK